MLSVRNMYARNLPHLLLFLILAIISAGPDIASAGHQDKTMTLPGQPLREGPIAGRLQHSSTSGSDPALLRRPGFRSDIAGTGSRE